MKIAPKAAEAFLKAPNALAVLLYGPDGGLARERAKALREAVLGKDYDPFALVEFSEAKLLDDPARLTDEILAVSMMAPKRVIAIDNASDKLTGLLREALPHFHDDTFLIVTAAELSTRSPLRAWFENEPKAATVACYHDEIRDIEALIKKSLFQAGIAADGEVVDYLSQQLGNDRFVTRQELAKIEIFASKNKVLNLKDAQALVDYNREANLDDFISAVADKNIQAIDRLLQIQLREGIFPVMYLRSLSRYFNRLYFIRAQMKEGKPMDGIIAGLKPKVFYKQEQSLRRHVQSWELPQLAKALALLTAAELACKTSDLPAIPASTRRLMQLSQIR